MALEIILIFLIFTWVTFSKFPSPALVSTWSWIAFVIVLRYLDFVPRNLVYVSLGFFVIALALTAIVSGGLKNE